MPNSTEGLIWESTPRPFTVSSAVNILRCPAEISPKRINEPKLVASMARQAMASCELDIRSGPVICPHTDKSRVRSLLRDLPLVTFLSSDWSSVMKWLTKITTPQVATVVGKFPLDRDLDLERWAESLVRYNPEWQKSALQDAIRQLEHTEIGYTSTSVEIGEERPGKCVRLDPQQAALKFMTKKYTQALARNENYATKPLLADVGWGAGSLVVEPGGNRQLACCEFDISGRELQLAATGRWLEKITNWIETVADIKTSDLAHIEISTPYLVVAGYLASRISQQGRAHLVTPDLLWGWHPLLSLLQFLATSKQPSLLMNLHHGSGLQMALIW